MNVLTKFKNTFTLWFRAARGYTMPTTIIPYVLAVALASKYYEIDYFLSFLGLIGVILAHLSVNLMDDYFDWKKGAVEEYKKLLDAGMQARTHKCFYLEENLMSIVDLRNIIIAMDLIAILIGLYIAYEVGFIVLVIAFIAGALGFFYSAPPVRLSYHGLSEIAIGIIYGPLLMAGAYITAGGVIDNTLIIASLFVGIFIANISLTHAIMDFDADKKVGKASLPTFLGSKKNATVALATFYGIAYVIFIVGLVQEVYPPISALAFLTLPKVIGLVRLMESETKEKKLWMGPIENWKALQDEGSDWFMMRLCLSRNIMTEFILILVVSYLVGQ